MASCIFSETHLCTEMPDLPSGLKFSLNLLMLKPCGDKFCEQEWIVEVAPAVCLCVFVTSIRVTGSDIKSLIKLNA